MHYLQALADGMTADAELEVIRQVGAIIASFVTAIGLVAVGILNRTRQHTKRAGDNAEAAAANTAVIRAEVKNSHSTNLRDEFDERHMQIMETLEHVVQQQREHGNSIRSLDRGLGGLREDVRELRSNLEHERDRIRELEDTRPIEPRPTRRASRKDPS